MLLQQLKRTSDEISIFHANDAPARYTVFE